MGSALFDEDDIVRMGSAAPIVLRDYQEKARAAVLGAKDRGLARVMIVQPTGTGKTTVFASLVDAFERQYGAPALVLAHRQELLMQAAERIATMVPRLQVGLEGGDAKAPFEARAVVAGVQTIGRPDSKRLDWFSPGLIVIDEGHHAPADSYQNVMRRFGSYDGRAFTVAVTATDHRMDNRPLHGGGAIFEDVVFRYSLRQAVADGWLVDLRGFRVATGVDISGVRTQLGDYNLSQLAKAVNTEERNLVAYQHWREVAGERRTIVFCVDVQHAKDVAQLFRDWHVEAEHVDGTMPSHQRDGVLRRWRTGKSQVLINVDICTEGFDAPECGCVVMLRPTQSWALYTQMAGRGVRVLPGTVDGLSGPGERRAAVRGSAKTDCIVIDVVDVSKQFSLTAPPEEGADDLQKAVAKAEGHASLAGMMGLPPELDLQGRSLFQAAEAWEELPPVRRAEMFRRQTSFDDLSTVLSEVDLLKELSIPEEIVGVTQLAWLKVGEAAYHLPCGSGPGEGDRVARIEGDELGRWHLTLRSRDLSYPPLVLGESLERAFDEADRTIAQFWPDAARIVRGDAGWRTKMPSERQIELLRTLGVNDAELAIVETRGQARALIEQRRLGRVPRRRLL